MFNDNASDLDRQKKLEELINAEKSGESFTQMPNAHYMEITNVLLNCRMAA